MMGPELRLKTLFLPLLLALQFLTRIPMPDLGRLDDKEVGRSLLAYPLVGALLGALLLIAAELFNPLLPGLYAVQAALLLLIWVAVTGGLHLDGFADSVDAWAGGFGDRERTLAIMKDPSCGPAAVVWLLLLLLCKWVLLTALLSSGSSLLWLAPFMARAAVVGLFVDLPYVRPGGLGAALAEYCPRQSVFLLLVICLVLTLFAGPNGAAALLAVAALYAALRWLMLQRLGGFTGDTAGALLESVELVVLLALVLKL